MRRTAMHDLQTAFTLAVTIHETHGVPVFPVRIAHEEGSWHKKPLVKWGSISGDPAETVWNGANAVGVPMGSRSGLITVDLDDYKEGAGADRWLHGHNVPLTRTHGTASGGRHLIFRLPKGATFGNRAPDVTGVDIRGNGGFIVWGDVLGRYTVLRDCPPAPLPESLWAELLALQGSSPSHGLADADIPALEYVDTAALVAKLEAALASFANRSLSMRFQGSKTGLKDKSRSGMDMSVAALLAACAFSFSEITEVLLLHFQHGTAQRDGWSATTVRAAKRCAARALHAARLTKETRIAALVAALARHTTEQESAQEADQ